MHRYIRMRDMPKEILRTMGKRLKMLREETDMDQRQFARAVSQRGVSVTNSFVSSMESGRSKPSIDVLVALANELEVSADYLLMRTDIPDMAENMLAEIEKRQQDTGAGVSEEAMIGANIIDGVKAAGRRAEIVEVLRLLADQAQRSQESSAAPGAASDAADSNATKSAETWIDSVNGLPAAPAGAAAPKVGKRRSLG